MPSIRFAAADDASDLLEIYKKYITTPITLEYELPTSYDVVSRIMSISASYPYLVLEENHKILAYVFAYRHLEHPALSWNAQVRAYVDLNERAKGYGKLLMELIMDILKIQGVYNIYSIVTEGNPRAESIHNKLGFHKAGTAYKTGYKNGRWLDQIYYEKRINSDDTKEPAPFIPIRKIDYKIIENIIESYNQKLRGSN